MADARADGTDAARRRRVMSLSSLRAACLVLALTGLPVFAAAQSANERPQGTDGAEPSLLAQIAADFVSFPLRRSTWVIVSSGIAGAAAVHPADDTFNARLAGADAFFAPG